MSNYSTIVFRVPEDQQGKGDIFRALRLLDPYQTGISLADELTLLECIVEDPRFDPAIMADAVQRRADIHAAREQEENKA